MHDLGPTRLLTTYNHIRPTHYLRSPPNLIDPCNNLFGYFHEFICFSLGITKKTRALFLRREKEISGHRLNNESSSFVKDFELFRIPLKLCKRISSRRKFLFLFLSPIKVSSATGRKLLTRRSD